jgi:hypothetical protein
MATPRRQILRPPASPPVHSAASSRQINRLVAQLDAERATLARWTSRLKRAFHAFERQQARIKRLEQRLARVRP